MQDRTECLQRKGIVLFDTQEAADRLRISPRTLERWRLTGNGPEFIKVGRLVFYVEDSLDAWVLGRVRRSTSDTGML